MHRKSRRCFVICAVIFALCIPSLLRENDATFAIISDTHVGAGASQYISLMHLLNKERVNLVIHTGDAIYNPGKSSHWKKFQAEIGLHQRVLLAAGNHDITDDKSLKEYLKFFPKLYYSFSREDILFVLLNTELPGQGHAIEGQQLAWLQSELERHVRYKFVFMHEPFFSFDRLSSIVPANAYEPPLHTLFKRNRVSLVVTGHYHKYRRVLREGVTYISMPPAHYVDLMQLISGASEPGYVIAERKNDSFSFRVVSLYGRVMDEFSISR